MDASDEIAEEQQDTGVSSMGNGVKLETIVGLPTWREALLELVDTHKLDPWNIDIVEVASGYLQKIRNMEMLDLRIPANLILAAAILIRFKSDALRFEEQAPLPEEAVAPDEDYGVAGIPPLELNGRIPPKRMVTLDELITAMDRVFDEQKKREEKAGRIEIPSVMNIELPEFNIEQRMAEVYGRVLEEKDSEGLATFSSLLREGTSEEIIYTLLPMLHLVQDRKLTVFQEKFFGEIFIRVQEESGKVKGENGKTMTVDADG
jgi:segregation and condensation protein A